MGECRRVGVLTANLFVRVPVELAVRGCGAEPVFLAALERADQEGCRAVVLDLQAVGPDPQDAIAALTQAGILVLAFGPHVEAEALRRARQAGAVALPRSTFLERLPQLLRYFFAGCGVPKS